ncbi:hypothetical protein HY086_04075 [Candidatus Gottesmanbacteria bacterium]|nr:hypothetical protein [Candidatus Gottesmanbacteria bacterium]
MRKIFFLSLCFFSFLLFQPVAKAAPSPAPTMLRVSPIILPIRLAPGSIQKTNIRLTNLLSVPLPVAATIEGFDAADEEGAVEIHSPQAHVSPLVDWMSLDQSDQILPAGASRDIAVTITVPKSVPLGGYYAVIFFTPKLPTGNISAKIGVIALANIGVGLDPTHHVDIVSFGFGKSVYEKGPVDLTLRVHNTSLNYFSVKPTLTIAPLFGNTQTIQLEEKTILPGKIRRWHRSLNLGPLTHGLYWVSLRLSLENGQEVVAKTSFIGFPVTKTIVFFLGSLALGWILLNRRRTMAAIKAFF